MEKKIIKVNFDDKLNYTFLNLESLRLGSNGSVEMWFNFRNYESGSTYKLNAMLPNKETLFEILSTTHEDEDGKTWVIWKITDNYTKLKGQILITINIYKEDLIFATQTFPIYCMFSVYSDTENIIITPNEYEQLLYALSTKADLGDNGKVLKTQLPEAYGTSDYLDLINKPKINDVELNNNLTFEDLGLRSINDLELASIFGE